MMRYIDNNRECVVYGTGLEAATLLYKAGRDIRVAYFIEDDPKISVFCNKPVYINTVSKIKNRFIIVATKPSDYIIVSEELEKLGCVEFRDYVYYEWLYKRIVLMHGNCHMDILRRFLETSEDFKERYSFYPNPPIQANKKGYISAGTIKNCDVWMHQDIQPTNSFSFYLSDEYIRDQLRDDAKEITIPNLFGYGMMYFPQCALQNDGIQFKNTYISNGEDRNGLFPHTDGVIDSLILKWGGVEHIKQISDECHGKPIDLSTIQYVFDSYMEKIRDRQKGWDIDVYGYIQKNYKKGKLFYDPGHPTNRVIKQIALQVLENCLFHLA